MSAEVLCVLRSSRLYRRAIMDCPSCDRRHRFIVRWDGVWYGTTEFGSCGDSWQDGYRAPRPFARGWRDRARAEFAEMWAAAIPPRQWRRETSEQVREEMEWHHKGATR